MEYYFVGTAIAGVIGLDMTLNTIRCVNTITASTDSIYKLVNCIHTHPQSSDIIKVLNKCDIEIKVRIIESLIKNLKLEKITEPIILCLNSLKESIALIEKELCDIHTKLNYNYSLWMLKSFREYDFSANIFNLHIYNNMLDNRKTLFFDIIHINNDLLEDNIIDLDKKESYKCVASYVPTSSLDQSIIVVNNPTLEITKKK